MRFLWLLPLAGWTTASPFPQREGADSCPTDPLSSDTWAKLNIDQFLTDWVANATEAEVKDIQAMSDAFGAPNFFCGLDSFCNAGQPCLPVEPPAWYALLAVQNWNSYMNSVNTAINFASSIMSLYLPGVISDLKIEPRDDITPLKDFYMMFTTVLGLVPFTGQVATASGIITGATNFIVGNVQPPEPTDKFATWSDVAGQLSTVVQDYQASLSTAFNKIIDTQVASDGGIISVISGGNFLGQSRNITQSDLQKNVIDSLKVYSLGLALQAQGVQLSVATSETNNGGPCTGKDENIGKASLCVVRDDGTWRMSTLVDKDFFPQNDIMETLINKYGLTQQRVTHDPLDCEQGKDTFATSLPLDSNDPCLFFLPHQGGES